MGSRGAGVSLSRGAETLVKATKASENSLRVVINGSVSNSAEVTKHVVDAFLSRFKEMDNFEISVEHHFEVPVGAGFGTSGAAALSLALALNETFDLAMPKTEAAQLAHMAEIECRTGLGTVIAETFGGVEIRVKPGAPGIGEVRSLPIPNDTVVACLVFGPLSTKKFLSDEKIRRRINKFGGKLVNELIEAPTIRNFLNFSRQFAEHVGLITDKVRHVLDATDDAGIVCSMPMFGESVFTLIEQENVGQLLQIFRNPNSNRRIIVSEIDHQGARLLW
jgi:pantoate kinase